MTNVRRALGSALLALWGLAGCAHQVAWQIQPVPAVRLPSLEVAVIAEDRACKDVADALVRALAARPGVAVEPGADVQLRVADCRYEVLSTEDVELIVHPSSTAPVERTLRRRFLIDGWATAGMTIHAPGLEPRTLASGAERHDRTSWGVYDEGADLIRRDQPLPVARFDEGLTRDLAWNLADHVAPLPETLRRRLYADPEPGTARALHNRAVDSEKAGRLDEALRLARDAYVANPTPEAMAYIQALKDHAARVGYALAE